MGARRPRGPRGSQRCHVPTGPSPALLGCGVGGGGEGGRKGGKRKAAAALNWFHALRTWTLWGFQEENLTRRLIFFYFFSDVPRPSPCFVGLAGRRAAPVGRSDGCRSGSCPGPGAAPGGGLHPLPEPSYRPTEGSAVCSLRRARGRSSALPVAAVHPPHGGPWGHGAARSPPGLAARGTGQPLVPHRPQRTPPTGREPHCDSVVSEEGGLLRSPPARLAVNWGDLATSGSAFRGGEPHRPPRGSQDGREELPSPRRDSSPPPPPPGCITWGRPSRPHGPNELTWCRALRCQGGQPASPLAEGRPGSAVGPAPWRRGRGRRGGPLPSPSPTPRVWVAAQADPAQTLQRAASGPVAVGARVGLAADPGGCPAECSPVVRLKRSISKRGSEKESLTAEWDWMLIEKQ